MILFKTHGGHFFNLDVVRFFAFDPNHEKGPRFALQYGDGTKSYVRDPSDVAQLKAILEGQSVNSPPLLPLKLPEAPKP